ncbi:MAG: hypothetical protein K2L16_05000 [Muribaculaceae bacterium]|nr:hypothetical protein [Muribaculaceae bacterium]
MTRALLRIIVAAAAIASAASCHSIDDDRIPPSPVNLPFITQAQWNIYGVAGAMDYKYFIREQRQPANYPYTAASYTGFGGILLVSTVLGEPAAFDLACPVERSKNVRVFINTDDMVAECPECHSTYDVFSLAGYPMSGPAANNGYGLKMYHVGPGRVDYMTVSF